MHKSKRLSDSALPYATVISQFLHKLNVPHETELFESVKDEYEFKDKHIRQMGYEKRGNVWVEKGSAIEGEGEEEEAEEHAAEAEEAPAEPSQQEMLKQILEELRTLNTKHDQLADKVDSIFRKIDEKQNQESSSDEIES